MDVRVHPFVEEIVSQNIRVSPLWATRRHLVVVMATPTHYSRQWSVIFPGLGIQALRARISGKWPFVQSLTLIGSGTFEVLHAGFVWKNPKGMRMFSCQGLVPKL